MVSSWLNPDYFNTDQKLLNALRLSALDENEHSISHRGWRIERIDSLVKGVAKDHPGNEHRGAYRLIHCHARVTEAKNVEVNDGL